MELGVAKFPNWKAAITHAQQLRDRNLISESEFRRIKRNAQDGGGGATLFAKLPKNAQAQADKFIKDDGLFLLPGETAAKHIDEARERYAAHYFETNEEK